jgi:8-oxo-dGTP pyrophosphatase MutT (NUDIX family)
MTYDIMTTETKYEGKIFSVISDGVTMPDGSLAQRDVVTKKGAVAVLVFNDVGEIALVHQYRHPMGEKLWEIPAGTLDVEGEEPLEAAQRELLEEIGYTAAKWAELVKIAASPGFTDERTTIYLASDLTQEGRPDLGGGSEEADMELRWVPIDTALEWVREGKIINAHTVSGILAIMAFALYDEVG